MLVDDSGELAKNLSPTRLPPLFLARPHRPLLLLLAYWHVSINTLIHVVYIYYTKAKEWANESNWTREWMGWCGSLGGIVSFSIDFLRLYSHAFYAMNDGRKLLATLSFTIIPRRLELISTEKLSRLDILRRQSEHGQNPLENDERVQPTVAIQKPTTANNSESVCVSFAACIIRRYSHGGRCYIHAIYMQCVPFQICIHRTRHISPFIAGSRGS